MTTSHTIEDIILQDDARGISALRNHLPKDFVARSAQRMLKHSSRVMIVTGFYIADAGAAETDGPPGAVALGNALARLGSDVSYVTDQYSVSALNSILPVETQVVEFPITDHQGSAQFADELLSAESPTLLVAIERAGLTSDGTFRNRLGRDISQFNAKTDYLFPDHPVTVGIGDGGNEIGMGQYQGAIAADPRLPDNPCLTQTSDLIIASCSNWGAYGLVAAISRISGTNLLPTVETAKEWVRTMIAAGAIDAMGPAGQIGVDGRTLEEDAACLSELWKLFV